MGVVEECTWTSLVEKTKEVTNTKILVEDVRKSVESATKHTK